MENIEKTKRVIRVPVKKTVIFIVIIGVILIGFISLYRSPGIVDYTYQGNRNKTAQPSTTSGNLKMMSDSYYPVRYQENLSISDTREFLKTSYSADIETRNVKSVLRDVKGAIRVANGRIDGLNENQKMSYVNFVIPKINFESFKDEIESITHEKLITENISSLNLLSQKQNIEEQNKNATDSLTTLLQQQKNLVTKHTQTKNKLQNELTDLENQLEQFSRILPSVPNPTQVAQLQSLNTNIGILKQQLASENLNFNTSNKNLKNQINAVNAQLANIAKQDSNFTDNVETVNGSISVKWISLWRLIKIFSPISPVIIIIILVIIFWYILKRKNYLPKVEFV
ncbi:MAG: hypothetical protein Q8L01_02995 [Candidatus Woesebacteria bacterium]|nr:hypothetical protein [Candidatus Woesebacteria bacterium]